MSYEYLNMVWPLAFVLCFLFVLRKVEADVRPIVTGVVGGLAGEAANNSKQWGIAIMFGLSASLSAFYDVFSELTAKEMSILSWHQYAAYWAKVTNPFVVAVLAYVTQSNFSTKGTTKSPFTPASP
jgi:hypothetical protein